MLESSSQHELKLTNMSRIISLPCREDTIRGFSFVDLLILDEAARIPDDLYWAVRPMLAVSKGRLLCLSPLRQTRLSGRMGPGRRLRAVRGADDEGFAHLRGLFRRGPAGMGNHGIARSIAARSSRWKGWCIPTSPSACAGFLVGSEINAIRAGMLAVSTRIEAGTLEVLAGRCPGLVHNRTPYRHSDDPNERRAEIPLDERNHALAALRYLFMRIDGKKTAKPTMVRETPPRLVETEEDDDAG